MKKSKSQQSDDNRIVRCIAYARVSTLDQMTAKTTSIESQLRMAEGLCSFHAQDNWVITQRVQDAGFSGGDLKRPGIKELLHLIKSEQVDQVIVSHIDRLTRSICDFYDLWDTMQAHNVNLVSCYENIDTTTSIGKAFLNIILTFAQFERELTSDRLKEKFAGEAKDGMKHPGVAPFGFENDPGNRSLIPIPEEAKIVKEIYELIIELKSPAHVAKELNKRGYRTKVREQIRKKQTVRIGGVKWTADKVQRLLIKNHYRGITTDAGGNEYTARWKGIVTDKTWKQAQEALSSRDIKIHAPRANKHEMLLKGKLECGHCNQAMSPKPGGKRDNEGNPRNYYTCQHVNNYGKDSECTVRNLPGKTFDDFIITIISEFGKHPDIIRATLEGSQKELKKSTRPLKSELKELNKRYRELSKEIKAVTDTVKKSGASIGKALMAEADKIAKEREEVELQQNMLQVKIQQREGFVADENMIAQALTNFSEVFGHLNFDDQTKLMDLLIERIRITAFDPEKDSSQCDPETFITQIRTSWYRIDIDFCIKSLFRDVYKKAGKSSYFRPSGGEGGIRTLGRVSTTHHFQ